jgi:outer membrane murein-binding lipoprotein Lpp
MLGRRRPLLRAAAVGGVGYMAGKSIANRNNQMDQMQSQVDDMQADSAPAQAPPPPAPAPAAAAPAAPPTAPVDVTGELERLADLRDRGVLSDAEFALEKSRLLGR